jgi:hypothetical protein
MGMIFMKTLEFASGAFGILVVKVTKRNIWI